MRSFDTIEVIVPDALVVHGKFRSGKTALVCGTQRFTWGELNTRVNRVANALIYRGLRKGDKVSLLSSNCIEMPEIIMGTVRAGGVIVPLSAMVTGDSLARMIDNSDSKFLIVQSKLCGVIDPFRAGFAKIDDKDFYALGDSVEGWSGYSDLLELGSPDDPDVKLTYDDQFNIMYTSGTTGLPKGILHNHGNRMFFAMGLGMDLDINSSSVGVVSTSLYANGTWIIFLPVLFAGGTLVIMPAFDPTAFAQLVQEEKCTHTFMAPVQFMAILDQVDFETYDLTSMKVWLSAGSAMRTDTKQAVLETFPGEFMELWGLTEGVATIIGAEDAGKRPQSVGLPMGLTDIRIIDHEDKELPRGEVGEIAARGPFLMPEYYKLPEKTAEDLWVDEQGRTYLKTGDVGRLDEEGFLYVMDRKKDMIVSGGINIFASDIEEIMAQHPDIMDVAVIAVPHEKWGESPMALVVKSEGAAVTEQEIVDWTNPRLAKYQRVAGIEFRTEFPRNALGKVLKKELREPYWKRA